MLAVMGPSDPCVGPVTTVRPGAFTVPEIEGVITFETELIKMFTLEFEAVGGASGAIDALGKEVVLPEILVAVTVKVY